MPNVNLPLAPRGIWIPAWLFMFPDGTWTQTRNAGGNYTMLKTAAAATTHPVVNLAKAIGRILSQPPTAPSVNAPLGAELQAGGLFTDFDVIYTIGTAGLTSFAATLYQTAFANNAAPVISSPGGTLTGTLATATQVQPYRTKITLASPYLIGNNQEDVADYLELVIVDPGTTVFALYGVVLKFNANR